MSKVANKIEAKDRSIRDMLDKKKYTIDYFQREYKWQQKHIEQLIADLETAFMNNYKEEHERIDVADYNGYYLGPIVLSEKEGKKSIIDGQQRLTSLSLFLIYLNNLSEGTLNIDSLIYSENFGQKSFNMDVPERQTCMNDLFQQGSYELGEKEDDSVVNIVERYHDIENLFPEELKGKALPYFVDWLIEKVVLVEITAYSNENAYTIFETMNDRGLNLTATEMLKGYILSCLRDPDHRTSMNQIWKGEIQQINEHDKDEDQKFFQSWLRGQYAVSIRPGKVGSANEDFEKVGTRFHTWVKDNHANRMGLKSPASFYDFVSIDFPFFVKQYRKVYAARWEIKEGLEHVYYAYRWGFATSLQDPLLLAPINKSDPENVINQKINMVARFIETFSVYRAANFRTFSHSSIRYTMYNLVLEIRNKTVQELGNILFEKLSAIEENFTNFTHLRMHGQNKRFIKFLLARISGYVEQESGKVSGFVKFYHNPGGKPYQIEHIWADKMEYHSDEFDQEGEFAVWRNYLGGLILLPQGTNQSFNADPYDQKLGHYIKENLLAQSLHPDAYLKNPNFRHFIQESGLPFKHHPQFKKQDIEDRQDLYQEICERIWDLKFFHQNETTLEHS